MKFQHLTLAIILLFAACKPQAITSGPGQMKRTVTIPGGTNGDILKFAIEDYLTTEKQKCYSEYLAFSVEEIDSINKKVDSVYNSGTYWDKTKWGTKKYNETFGRIAGADHYISVQYKFGTEGDTTIVYTPREEKQTVLEWALNMEKKMGLEAHYNIVLPLKKIKIKYYDTHTGKKLWKMKKSSGPFSKGDFSGKLKQKAFEKFSRKFPYCSKEK